MDRYQENAKWLVRFAPFRALSVSAAYLTPFLLLHGLSLSQVFILQSIYSIALLLWEIPSGYIADRFGRAFSIKLSAPIAAVGMVLYGFSDHYWQFVLVELILALANGLISGIDTALLLDSLKGQRKEHDFVRLSQRINAVSFAATAAAVPLAVALVHYINVSATLIADGVLTAIGCYFAFKLVEAPRMQPSQEAVRVSAWHATKALVKNAEARWLVLLGAVLGAATYMAFWLSAPYYESMHVPVVWFSVILAVRSAWKAWLSHRFHQKRRLERNMFVYAGLAGLVYFAMASKQLWLIWVVLGHDVVQALQTQPITAKLNEHIHHEYRATLNSLVNLVQRLLYSLAGPLVGLMVDKAGLQVGFVVLGVVCGVFSLVAILRLRRFQTFADPA